MLREPCNALAQHRRAISKNKTSEVCPHERRAILRNGPAEVFTSCQNTAFHTVNFEWLENMDKFIVRQKRPLVVEKSHQIVEDNHQTNAPSTSKVATQSKTKEKI